MVWCYAAFGRWCSTIFEGAVYSRTVLIFVFVMANLIPVCLMTLNDRPEQPSTLWNMHYASSFLSLRSAWDMTGYWPVSSGIFRSSLNIRTWQINQPVAVVSVVYHAALALGFTLHGEWRQRTVVKRFLTVLYKNQPALPQDIMGANAVEPLH
jgi:hypothetical protein